MGAMEAFGRTATGITTGDETAADSDSRPWLPAPGSCCEQAISAIASNAMDHDPFFIES